MCKNVEELWLSGLSGLEVGDLSAGPNLRHLSFNECRVTPSITAPTILFPRLSTLYLKAVIFTGHALHQLLQPSTLPSLRHLDYISVHQSLVSPMPGSLATTAATPAAGPPGSTALASITASLASLAPQNRAAHPSSPSSTASDHPLLAFAPTLVTLSLGSHASRTIPGQALVSFVERAERLTGLCLPAGMLLEVGGLTDALGAGAPRLRAIRLIGKERALEAVQAQQQQRAQRNVGTWRSTAFDLLAQAMTTAESEAVDLGVAEQRQRGLAARDARRVEQAVQRVLGVFERLGTLGKGEKERVLSVPAQEDAADDFKEEIVFSRFASDASSGMLARIEHEPLEPCDGAWRLGTLRWRERVRLEESG
ncbi:hypothetical protein Rhopal_006739-T1 [Rhodotorula paludigena]|uniref:Uncharacterized protein n=1 Tax=Rhodotorula paludigena TaxID=86838 RepID=A0AAV5GXC1_9BASI|nr:hypothetical protein Rhopal_006739-T1 [Rhodotorula paludigena]